MFNHVHWPVLSLSLVCQHAFLFHQENCYSNSFSYFNLFFSFLNISSHSNLKVRSEDDFEFQQMFEFHRSAKVFVIGTKSGSLASLMEGRGLNPSFVQDYAAIVRT